MVSGWSIGPSAGSRTVYSDQAHQWAEVPFKDLGCIAFEPTASGGPVDAMRVDIFINENKEKGGVKIGIGTTDHGRFAVTLNLTAQFAGGSYQLIAHALADANYGDSWSDPEIVVYSGTGLRLS